MSTLIDVPTRGHHDDLPPSPPAKRMQSRPRWRQPRFIWGVGLIAASVILGATLIGAANNTVTVWAASHDLAPGTVVTADDIIAVSVSLDAADKYVNASGASIVGRKTNRQVMESELVPLAALESGTNTNRLVTVPVEPIHAPAQLAHGDRVDVFVSPRDAVASGASRLVVARALVAEVVNDIDTATGEFAVILDVEPSQAAALVSASRGGVIDLVHVPPGAM